MRVIKLDADLSFEPDYFDRIKALRSDEAKSSRRAS